MDILIKMAQFFLCLSLLVGIHELGHFMVARLFKMRVDKFYIFFNPWFSLFKWKRGKTEYGIGWLPLGGYVKIAGMVDESMDTEQMAAPAKPDEFRAKPAWQRLCVMVAGVVMNLIMAVAIFIGISYTWGEQYIPNSEMEWGYNFNESGEKLGFKDGDRLISYEGEEINDVNTFFSSLLTSDGDRTITVERSGAEVDIIIPLDEIVAMREAKGYEGLLEPVLPFIVEQATSEAGQRLLKKGDQIVSLNGEEMIDFSLYADKLSSLAGTECEFGIMREGELQSVTLPISDEGKIGVTVSNPFEYVSKKYTFIESIPAGFNKVGEVSSAYWGQLKAMVNPETKLYKEVGGFIAIGSVFAPEWNWLDFWAKAGLLSIMLAIMNMLPIPGLDGGHTLFTLWEIITRRKPGEKFMEIVQTIGMVLLLALALYANGSDIVKLFN